ncbi:MAG: YegS/Rv2252/BmrU family lipid kinase [Butyrivibrio sp.]|nr:YegS/Rv2252/BmrU family lipid kinase [Butyrivibrio sp.]
MAEKKKALILINKIAGTGRGANDALDMATALAHEGYEPIMYPIIPGTDFSSEKILAQYEGRVELVLCSGGDGTLNHVMSAMMDMKKKPLLAYIPAGSTNDFARGIGIPSQRIRAIDVSVHGKPYAYDVGKMNDRYFNYVAAFGAFSKVSYATDQELKNVLGYAAYVISAIAELPQNIGYSCHMKIESEGIDEEGDYVFGAMSNSASVGGMNLFGDTDVQQNDGRMELLLIKAPKNLSEFGAIITALANKEAGNPHIIFKQVHYARFISDEETEWTIDGEFGGSAKETDITVLNKAITIMTRSTR